MAISLITEVMDWAPEALTHREHKVLIILAEDARPASRVIWQSIESPQMMRRLRLSRTQLYVVIAALMAKGCLELVTQGGRGHVAKYRIPVLTPPFSVPENVTQNPADNRPFSVPETRTQSRSVSRKPGPSASRKPGPLAFNGAVGVADLVAPELAERVRERNGATPSQSLRDHDGPDNHGPDDQQRGIPALSRAQPLRRNARTRGAS
jgi:hypothetical protein